jgi:hypothetical protein
MQLSKPRTMQERRTRTVADTITLTPESIAKWHAPPFQRPVKENAKVLALAEQLKIDGGVIRGIITLGVLDGKTYIVDGQHRARAFLISALKEGYTDVRVHYFESMDDMADEFLRLNDRLVAMKPDDILRGLELSLPAIELIRTRCPFVGYDSIRRGPNGPVVSMASMLRAWAGSEGENPATTGKGTAAELARAITEESAEKLCDFLTLALDAFGRDHEYARLWGSLNMSISMWFYRRMVLSQYSTKTPRLTKEQFKRCLMSLSASGDYCDWLVGRVAGERDRAPAFVRIKALFGRRLENDLGKKVAMPNPAWSIGATASRSVVLGRIEGKTRVAKMPQMEAAG